MKKTLSLSFRALLSVLLLIVIGYHKPDAKDAPARTSNPLKYSANTLSACMASMAITPYNNNRGWHS